MMIFAGFGIDGRFIIGFGIIFTLFFSIQVARKKAVTLVSVKHSLQTGGLYYLIFTLLLYWVSIADYYFVEIFKKTGLDLSDNTYWVVYFGFLIPIVIILINLAYYIGSRNKAQSIRFLVISSFLYNANINDLLYYAIFRQPFPDKWTWLTQPKYLFGQSINTVQVFLWVIICIGFSLVALLYPFEELTKEKTKLILADISSKKVQVRLISYYVIMASLFGASFIATPFIVQKINNSINAIPARKYTLLKQVDLINTLSPNYNIEIQKQRIDNVNEINSYLDAYHSINGIYPKSSGNCRESWDSSYNGLSFKIRDQDIHDPEELKATKCYLENNNKTILYYSDGNDYALIVDGQMFDDKNQNIYNPNINDVYWFDTQTQLGKDWNWKQKMLVYMFKNGKEITKFKNN
ncbi:MAG: hypothetical protein H7196_02675 [candidate division SR1 bacterium]|nr:hypothetical protein [candidate division SR1 bacterium]